eukprot:CAMPEP_0118633882 /NCGR_PEP_ID=MMETSP0785-20121206/1237_1 /TAXON_ID=91992 /ORGANISM="Bolidomonas pacifica, Strain CCMP 1866" /LENGTH=461 /DNA_ID=CAMNT_0006524793 /DNA_START=51 /DNA_END=1434 /DNA_ORIENTATION=-
MSANTFIILDPPSLSLHLWKNYVDQSPNTLVLDVPSGTWPCITSSSICIDNRPLRRVGDKGALIANFRGLSTSGVMQYEGLGSAPHDGELNKSISPDSIEDRDNPQPTTSLSSIFPSPKPSSNVIFSVRPCLLLPTVLNYFLRLHSLGHNVSLILVPCCTHPSAVDLDSDPGNNGMGTIPSIKFKSKLQTDICDDIVEFIKVYAPETRPRWEQVRYGSSIVKDVRVVLAGDESEANQSDEFWEIHDMPPPPQFSGAAADEFYDDRVGGGMEDDDELIKINGRDGRVYEYFVNKSDGVLAQVGMEPWDAGYALLATILSDSSDLQGKRVLEVGAGIGFVGLTIGREERDTSVHLTDYDGDVLRILNKNTSNVGQGNVSCGNLDWFEEDTDKVGSFDVIIGAEVLYTPNHKILADVIFNHLKTHGKAIIVNMKRPGFDDFVHRSKELGLKVNVKMVEEGVVEE